MSEVDFTIHQETRGSAVIFRVQGELDFLTAPPLKEALTRALTGEIRTVAVDLSGVPFVDSAAVCTLLTVRKSIKDHGGQLVLLDLSPYLRQLFVRLGLVDLFEFVPAADLPPRE